MKKYDRQIISAVLAGWAAVALCSASALQTTLEQAGANSAELQKVLDYYKKSGDRQKLQAARFLISNMAGHGYIIYGFYNPQHKEIAYNALDYPDFARAQAAMDKLEKKYGNLSYQRKKFIPDATTITADYLIKNIDAAFRAWRGKPWARNISFEIFCEYILPYRGSNEPLNYWRGPCLQRYRDLPGKLKDKTDIRQAARYIQQDVHRWVRFNSLYYLHPTDQGFSEMCRSGQGRCEDITNMMLYALRANAIPVTSDYTPFWADRDNNHAWEVILDANGKGRAGLSNRAAKIYRKTFALQRDSLGFIKTENEQVPRWLAGKNFRDVTDDYMTTSDVLVHLTKQPPAGTRFAYICVFNGGDWQAIHWGRIKSDHTVIFTRMGRNIAYLPAWYIDNKLVPAAPPFILGKDGHTKLLQITDSSPKISFEAMVTRPETPDADTHQNHPVIKVKPGKIYELFVWKDGWKSCGRQRAAEKPVFFRSVPAEGLYWLVAQHSRRLERIFTIENNRQVWW